MTASFVEEGRNQDNKKMRENIIKAAKFLFGLGLLVFVIHWTGLDSKEALNKILLANRYYLLIAFTFVFIAQIFGIKRWQILSGSLGINIVFPYFFKLHFLGMFCNNLLPSMGGDVVKAFYLAKQGQKKHESLLSVILDRYVGLLVMLFMASLAALSLPSDDFNRNLKLATWGILLAFISGGVVTLFFSELVAKLLEKYHTILEKYKKEHWPAKIRELSQLTKDFVKNYYTFGSSLLLSVISQCFAILAVQQLSLSVGANVSASTVFVVVPIVLLISALPISPGGLGTREVAFVYLLTNVYTAEGIDKDFAKSAAALVAFLWLAINILISLLGAMSYFTIGNDIDKVNKEELR